MPKPIILACILLVVFGIHDADAEQPNVVLIITDDQGYGDVSAHGSPVLKTPNLDRLREGCVRFSDFHVAPMCSPTRGQLMTGIDAMRNGCTAVCQGRSMMRSELPTMADFFANSGYATGHFGKWHLGDSYPHRPQDRGFEETVHHRAWGITSLADYWGNTYFDPVLAHNGVDKQYDGYCTDIFFTEAMNWIDKVQTGEKPFFLYLATNTPHVPNICPDEYSAPYVGQHEGKPIPSKFYGMIANLDDNLGRLESFLADRSLSENTILIYMSDNGTQSREARAIFNAGMRDRKTSVYEGGHRVPFMIRWPNSDLLHGRDVEELTQVQDLLPTLIELCDLKNESSATFDGASLSGLLKGTSDELSDRKLVIQYRVSGAPWDPAVVLWDKWRLVNGSELYHIGRDPGQRNNVAERNPHIVEAMSSHYDKWHEEARVLFERPRWITVGSDAANPMVLYSQDWVGDYCDNPRGLRRSTARGYWNVEVDRDALYEIELRRWPRESNKSLTEGWTGPDDTSESARPIASARLKVCDTEQSLDIVPTDTNAIFRVHLQEGKTRLETTFLDAQDEAICSAIYVYIKRIEKNESSSDIDN